MHHRASSILFGLLVAAAVPAANAQPTTSFFPTRGVAQFLAENFDLASIRSSFGNRRTPAKRTFADFGMVPTAATEELLAFDDPTWYHGIKVLRRGDFNKDGIEDLEICFVDRAKEGSYNAQQPLLVTRYSATTYAVAMIFELDGCEKFSLLVDCRRGHRAAGTH